MASPPLPPRNPSREKKHNSVATSQDDLIAALHLVADSVAQQRQPAARALIYHPIYWTTMLALLSYIHHTCYRTPSDYPTILLIWCGCLMSSVTVVKYLVRGYLDAAEKTGRWTWLYGEESDKIPAQGKRAEPKSRRSKFDTQTRAFKPHQRDLVLVSWYREKIVGVVILRVERVNRRKTEPGPESTSTIAPTSDSSSVSTASVSHSHPHPHVRQSKHWKAYIRAWTVEQRYRGNGIGREVLSFAVRFCHASGFGDPVFADDHAHSLRVLPWGGDGWIRDVEDKARKCLEKEILADRV